MASARGGSPLKRRHQEQFLSLPDGTYQLMQEAGNGVYSDVWKGKSLIDNAVYAFKCEKPSEDKMEDNPVSESAPTPVLKTDSLFVQGNLLFFERSYCDYFIGPSNFYGNANNSNEPHFIRMPFLSGCSLEKAKVENDDQCVLMLINAAKALLALHNLKVVHGDVKETNFFLMDGKITHIKMIDFGLTRMVDEVVTQFDPKAKTKTTHLAPEIFDVKGQKASLDQDIYSFGSMIGRILHNFSIDNPKFFSPFYHRQLSTLAKLLKSDMRKTITMQQVIIELKAMGVLNCFIARQDKNIKRTDFEPNALNDLPVIFSNVDSLLIFMVSYIDLDNRLAFLERVSFPKVFELADTAERQLKLHLLLTDEQWKILFEQYIVPKIFTQTSATIFNNAAGQAAARAAAASQPANQNHTQQLASMEL